MEGRNNSQAAATTHEDVAEGLAEADKAMVADAMIEIAWLYSRVNAGPGVFSPVFAYEEPEDLQARADLDKKLYEIGLDFTAEHFQENYSLKPSEFTLRAKPAEIPSQFKAGPGGKTHAPAYLAEEAQKRLDAAIQQILPEALKASGKVISKIENAVKNAESLDALELALADLLAPQATPSELEDLLARTMTAAAGFGAAAVKEEAGDE
jgi:phage gp29-like protein